MKTLEESVVLAMDGHDKALFPFLPFILQDLWEIGADPETIIELIGKHSGEMNQHKLLDLGCGKGAVSVKVAKMYGCKCLGIDAIPEFIHEARNKASEFGVAHLCNFEVGDIRNRVKSLAGFDWIILGATGPVFGDYYTTLKTLKGCLKNTGFFIIDDGYLDHQSNFFHSHMQKKEQILEQIKKAGMYLADERVMDKEDIRNSDTFIFNMLKKRCMELTEMYPDKTKLFEEYILNQEKENAILENKVICSTMVIKKSNQPA